MTTPEQKLKRVGGKDRHLKLLQQSMLQHFEDDRGNFHDMRTGFLELRKLMEENHKTINAKLDPIVNNYNTATKAGKWLIVSLSAVAMIATAFGGFGVKWPWMK